MKRNSLTRIRKSGIISAMKLDNDTFLQVVSSSLLVAFDLIVRAPDETILVGLRLNRPAQGFWFVPGGRIQKEERLPQAFERITRMELGQAFPLEAARFYGLYEHLYADNFAGVPDVGTHYIVLAYELRLSAALGSLPEEQHGAYRWLSAAELLADPQVHPNTKNYFNGNRAAEYARRLMEGPTHAA